MNTQTVERNVVDEDTQGKLIAIKEADTKGMMVITAVLVGVPGKLGTEIYENGNVQLVVKYE